jgi:CPA2 family monovalent cation:H+ antiporter-2
VTSKFLYPIAVAVSAITTLLTPYLIKASDGLVNQFDRIAPRSLVNTLGLYTNWVGRLGQRHPSMVATLSRRWLAQMALNIALITAVFISAAFVARHPTEWLKNSGLEDTWLKASLWLAATIVSLPMFIATSRKLQALGLLIAETKVTEAAAGERTTAIRAVVSQIIPIVGTVILGLYVVALSSALLPTFKVFMALLIITALISWFLRRSFIKVYSKAQIALKETFSQQPPPRQEAHPKVLPPLLREANLDTVAINSSSKAVGKRIRELDLRNQTGANVVGIERDADSIINPGPDEELREGDKVLLLGTRAQLDSAKAILTQMNI